MSDTEKNEARINARIAELQQRLENVEASLDEPASPDLEDQAVELEDDEVLEGVGRAGIQEIRLLKSALDRIRAGTYGTCDNCGAAISDERLEAVPYAILCRDCANAA